MKKILTGAKLLLMSIYSFKHRIAIAVLAQFDIVEFAGQTHFN